MVDGSTFKGWEKMTYCLGKRFVKVLTQDSVLLKGTSRGPEALQSHLNDSYHSFDKENNQF